ncbi:peptidyl-prolyl cis-trans isomerase [Campylobacter sp. faydin G-24]|uniref:Peptidyl-prolyl cis-trans isomerase n=1 Tax=Campylobacter anatolicus TaxID=2829105 RepID=A0ABS5HG71_9BACT|nr:peptidylprolyl isomerase [Campylobacter anatolicus]MBR8462279.1 peptidyl-prolyl cis-trans isomerase [Campylobacter anatolicus]MBR8463268.1 peptidyl-prolyl cis-trans isomerase [Campylobacter anatolicus]MBR8465418.1 peptidyl-prolyl cis-trans isomerase [Campylobacter anatolicus]
MLKKGIFVSFVCAICLNAQMVNGIAAIVENEPITIFEIHKLSKQLNTNEVETLNLLIKDRLQQAQIKNLGISASIFEINERIERLAQQNGMTNAQFRASVEAQGIKFADFRMDIEKAIVQEKLYQSILADANKNINENAARNYYETNISEFSVFSNADVVRYTAKSANELQAQIGKAGANKGVTAQNLSLSSSNIDPRLNAVIANTPNGNYTQILRSQDGFDMFYVKSKSGQYTPSFEQVKDHVLNILYQREQESLINDYFDKLRAKAKIQILR